MTDPITHAIETKGRLPDRRYEVVRHIHQGGGIIHLRPHDDGCGVTPTTETAVFRTWIVDPADGKTDVERELEELKAGLALLTEKADAFIREYDNLEPAYHESSLRRINNKACDEAASEVELAIENTTTTTTGEAGEGMSDE